MLHVHFDHRAKNVALDEASWAHGVSFLNVGIIGGDPTHPEFIQKACKDIEAGSDVLVITEVDMPMAGDHSGDDGRIPTKEYVAVIGLVHDGNELKSASLLAILKPVDLKARIARFRFSTCYNDGRRVYPADIADIPGYRFSDCEWLYERNQDDRILADLFSVHSTTPNSNADEDNASLLHSEEDEEAKQDSVRRWQGGQQRKPKPPSRRSTRTARAAAWSFLVSMALLTTMAVPTVAQQDTNSTTPPSAGPTEAPMLSPYAGPTEAPSELPSAFPTTSKVPPQQLWCEPKQDPDAFAKFSSISQIVLAVLAVFISYLYKFSHDQILVSRWRKAWGARLAVDWVLIPGFSLLTIAVLGSIVVQWINGSWDSSSQISTLLVAFLTVAFQYWNERFEFRVLSELRENAAMYLYHDVATTYCNVVPGANILLSNPKPGGMFSKRGDKVQRRVALVPVTPLAVGYDDYQVLGVVLQQWAWRIVTACEKSHEEFHALLVYRVLSESTTTSSKEPNDTVRADQKLAPILVLRLFCKLLALLEDPRLHHSMVELQPKHWYEHYEELAYASSEKTGGGSPHPHHIQQVILKNLFRSQEVQGQLRKWNDTFRNDVQVMLAFCPMQSQHREKIEQLAVARSESSHLEATSFYDSDVDLKIVYILFALQGQYNASHQIQKVTKRRREFLSFLCQCVQRLESSGEEIEKLCKEEDLTDLADALTLIFFRWRKYSREKFQVVIG